MEQFEFDLGIPIVEQPSDNEPNPMIKKVGYGPADAKCKTCVHLMRKVVHSDAKYYKCRKQCRPNKYTSQLEGKDYRLKWRACSYYKEGCKDEQG